MDILKERNIKYICVIAIILMQYFLVDGKDAISCVQCGRSGGNETKCSLNLTEKPSNCWHNDDSKCFTQIDSNGHIERGCITDAGAANCTADNNCVLTDSGKNNQLICKKCDGSDENCSQTDMSSNELKYNQICAEGTNNCIVKVENKLVIRGCANESDINQCTDERTCKACNSVLCNTGIFPTKGINCYQCSGSNCTDVAANSELSKPCLNNDEKDECYTKVKSETEIIRGCKSDTKDNQCSTSDVDGCIFCSADNCNNLKYKNDQALKCHQCSSDEPNSDCFKEQTSQEFKSCEKQILYNQTGYCYTQIIGNKIQRGCLYDNAELTLDNCKDSDGGSCSKCNSSDGCNKEEVSLNFTCIVCRSDLNVNCWNKADTIKGQECRTSESSPEEGCFHGIWNGVAIRGCLVDASIQNQEVCKDAKNHQCNVCNQKNCNTGKSASAGKNAVQIAVLLISLAVVLNFK